LANALALARFGDSRLFHSSVRGDGFGWLLLGMALIGLLFWAFNRAGQNESDKD
jgi:hypothetical protein